MSADSMIATLERRSALTMRLVAALKHLPHVQQIGIVSSFIGLDHLEQVVEFQENRS